MVLRRILTCQSRLPRAKNGVTAQNGEQPIRLRNDLLYPRVEVKQRTHSGDEIDEFLPKRRFCSIFDRPYHRDFPLLFSK